MPKRSSRDLGPLAILGAAAGGVAAAHSAMETTGEYARLAEQEAETKDFYANQGLIDAEGKIDKEKLDKWRRDNGLIYKDGDIEKFDFEKFQAMVRGFREKKAVKRASELTDI